MMHRKDRDTWPTRMKRKLGESDCGKRVSPREISLEDAGYDPIEQSVLEVARLFWQTFAYPQTQSWLLALQRAEKHFYEVRGDTVGLSILATIQAMRLSRKSNFQFNNPQCECCAALVTENEQQFMSVFQAVRDNRCGLAKTHAMILCEGNDSNEFIGRMGMLTASVYPTHKTWQHPLAVRVH